MRSCESAALRLKACEPVTGIFSPSLHADIMEALVQHKYMNDDVSLAMLKKALPPKLFESPHWKTQAAEEKKPPISESARRRKLINESLKGARQLVKWNDDDRAYQVEWVTRKELVVDQGEREAEELWDSSCFKGVYKSFHNFTEPVSQAQAMARWMNQGWSWAASAAGWKYNHHCNPYRM